MDNLSVRQPSFFDVQKSVRVRIFERQRCPRRNIALCIFGIRQNARDYLALVIRVRS